MSGSRRAKREAQEAASRADLERQSLEKERAELTRRKKVESQKAQRLLFRSLRAGSGGFFATDKNLGSDEVLG